MNLDKVLTKQNLVIFVSLFVLILITLLTKYYGSADLDYADTAKFFANEYSAKIRSSHSYLMGFSLFPLVKLTRSFIIFKITSIIFLIAIIFSVFYISKSKKTFWLILFLPVIWYIGPWMNPLQLCSLILIWAYYFINKYDTENNIKYLIYSGLLIGLGWAFWDTMLYLGLIFCACFLYNKKVSHFGCFVFFVIIGLAPRLILDIYLFNSPFFSILKSTFGTIANIWGGIYERSSGHTPKTFSTLFSLILAIPIYFWVLYHPKIFSKYKKTMLFLSFSLMLIFMNPQIRYLIVLEPIMIFLIGKEITKTGFKIQMFTSWILLLLLLLPNLMQISYSIDGKILGTEFTYVLSRGFNINLTKDLPEKMIVEDLNEIFRDYPNETFVVGNCPDDYQTLAHIYWGENVKEFVSIQDYNLYLKNNTILYEKIYRPIPNIAERRQIWIVGGMGKSEMDNTDYKKITLGLSIKEPLNLSGFSLVKSYRILNLYKKDYFIKSQNF